MPENKESVMINQKISYKYSKPRQLTENCDKSIFLSPEKLLDSFEDLLCCEYGVWILQFFERLTGCFIFGERIVISDFRRQQFFLVAGRK